MTLEEIQRWLDRRIRSESRNQFGLALLGGASGVSVTLLTTALGTCAISLAAHQIAEIGRAFRDWQISFETTPQNIAFIGVAFLALQLAGLRSRNADYIFYLPQADWRSNESAFQIIAALWYILLDFVYAGPRLILFSRERWRLRKEYRFLNQLVCSRVLYVLHCRRKRVPFTELKRLVPEFTEDNSLSPMLLIRGVMHLQSDPPGLGLNSELGKQLGSAPAMSDFDFGPHEPTPSGSTEPRADRKPNEWRDTGSRSSPSSPSFRCTGCRRKFRLRNLRAGVVFNCPLCDQEFETLADSQGRIRVQQRSEYYDPTADIELSGELTNAYLTLGLPPNSSPDEVKKAYRRLMKEFHPDMAANLSEHEREEFGERSKEINQAYADIIGK